MVLRISAILRKARNIKNCLAPINQIPAESLALVATFLPRERDLINATAVCQQWRAILLSFPRLWCNASGSSSELEAYLERSRSVPIQANLLRPELVVWIIPHTSRLVGLSIWVNDLREFNDFTCPLRFPIPTLHSLEIHTENLYMNHLELPPGIGEDLFLHLKKLCLEGISSLHGPQTFSHITELFLTMNAGSPRSTYDLLGTFEQLPGLEKIHAVFRSSWYPEINPAGTLTLPCVQELCLSAPGDNGDNISRAIPPILRYLKLPNLTSLTVDSRSFLPSDPSILPVASFSEHLPNYFELPEVRIDTTMSSGKITFRSPSQAVITFHTGALARYKRECRLWGDLPVSSVRRATAVLADPDFGREDRWLADMLMELSPLELLDLGGNCGWVLRRLRRRMAGAMLIRIQTLIVRGGVYAMSQASKLESAKDDLRLQNMTVTYIQDLEAQEWIVQDPDAESSSDEEIWDEDPDSSTDGSIEDDESDEGESDE